MPLPSNDSIFTSQTSQSSLAQEHPERQTAAATACKALQGLKPLAEKE
ncbi:MULTISPECIES: hypothetical protein [unclassified Synechococcus]|nr:hypothetical protein [Synechococcus sp. WH 8020]